MSAEKIKAAATKLGAAARNATTGPWGANLDINRDGDEWSVWADTAGHYVIETFIGNQNDADDATYIALANPALGLALASWLMSVHDALVPEPGRAITGIDERHALAIADEILGGQQ